METIEQKIDYYAESISKEICDMPNFDYNVLKTISKVRISFFMHELFSFGISDFEEKRLQLVKEYTSEETPKSRKKELQGLIVDVTSKKKALNRAKSTLRNVDEYFMFKDFIKERFGHEVLEEFFELKKNDYNVS